MEAPTRYVLTMGAHLIRGRGPRGGGPPPGDGGEGDGRRADPHQQDQQARPEHDHGDKRGMRFQISRHATSLVFLGGIAGCHGWVKVLFSYLSNNSTITLPLGHTTLPTTGKYPTTTSLFHDITQLTTPLKPSINPK